MEAPTEFGWDDEKAARVETERGISFAGAMLVFLDPLRLDFADSRRDYGEERRITIGHIEDRVATVVYTMRGNTCWIITVGRPADRSGGDTMVKFELDPKNPPRLSKASRKRLAALTDDEIDAMAASDPDALPPTEEMLDAAVVARRVRLVRERLGLSQAAFAERFRIPVGTLRDWEQGRRRLDAPAQAYLTVIERNPEAVEAALGQAA